MIFSLQETYEAKRKEFLLELQRKEEEMRQMFVNKVKETEAELKEKEKEVKTDIFLKKFYCILKMQYVCVVSHCALPHHRPSFTRDLSS